MSNAGCEASFSRAFRKRFGRAPRDVLAIRTTPDNLRSSAWLMQQAHASGYESIDNWLSEIGSARALGVHAADKPNAENRS